MVLLKVYTYIKGDNQPKLTMKTNFTGDMILAFIAVSVPIIIIVFTDSIINFFTK